VVVEGRAVHGGGIRDVLNRDFIKVPRLHQVSQSRVTNLGEENSMKVAILIARILLGLLFFVFGLNGFLHFIPMSPPTGLAGQYMGALFVSHYLAVVFLLEVVGGALLLANRFVPLALTLLGPVLVNILLFHSLLEPQGLPLALISLMLWLIVFAGVRQAFAGVFAHRVEA
jgi:putative oxidoreductase